jgi:DNA polymerase I-like protein with 3'-5' exonuclease and polymerase domains
MFDTRTLLARRRVVDPGYVGGPSFTERLNAPVQGMAADILKLVLANLCEDRNKHPDAIPIITVHDAIVLECSRTTAQTVAAWLAETMQEAVSETLRRRALAGEDTVDTKPIASWEEA